eukprot:CAMPEP_0116892492 /NCGR_PEP_ID=MMETSP0467-20121206/2698_1 /TAXON_ID=283647 /ORGANISM="Mesodinium pulex, Strain SPMC105" /LENGTH=75 /DNA_ID=CAMNT_0004561641 /DNA_START=685 /DNA_END=913 /DNA_ORIENTATION=+
MKKEQNRIVQNEDKFHSDESLSVNSDDMDPFGDETTVTWESTEVEAEAEVGVSAEDEAEVNLEDEAEAETLVEAG